MCKSHLLVFAIIIVTLSACGSEGSQPISQSTPIPVGVQVTNIIEENTLTSEIIQQKIFDQCDAASSFKAQVEFNQSSSQGEQKELVVKAVASGETGTGDLLPGVKVKIEGAVEQHFASSKTTGQGHQESVGIEVPPRTLQKYTIIWQETRREGMLEYLENGEIKTASYSYRIGLELVTASGKDIPCTDRTPTPKPTSTPEPTNTPKPPTPTPILTPTATSTLTPTVTVVTPTPTVTNTATSPKIAGVPTITPPLTQTQIIANPVIDDSQPSDGKGKYTFTILFCLVSIILFFVSISGFVFYRTNPQMALHLMGAGFLMFLISIVITLILYARATYF
jgi:hypothetical protein